MFDYFLKGQFMPKSKRNILLSSFRITQQKEVNLVMDERLVH